MELHDRFGFQIDDETQKMIDQATEAGIVGDAHKSAAERTVDGLNKVADRLDALLDGLGIKMPAAIKAGVDKAVIEAQRLRSGVQGAIDAIPKDINVNFHARYDGFDQAGDYAAAGGLVTTSGIVQYFGGGGFVPRGSDTVAAMLTPGESVLTTHATAELGRETIGALNRGATLNRGMNTAALEHKTDEQTRAIRAQNDLLAKQTQMLALYQAELRRTNAKLPQMLKEAVMLKSAA